SAPVQDLTDTVTAGGSSLSYDASSDQYVYTWKTDSSWTGCRQLVVTLNDGTQHVANFKFK
ncbi:MAG TPA: PxKF domain-containing protein, partial [Pyrinomonadaceae bacterium]|nr:PxKF domain-containing protein [Pyrinomonadaceae bacterium]